ncbi:hypothetical protein [Yinghuangia soli]|uniref:Tetratricopeptide repeat protein n=1 Tax=Yinghuangia soli TaxID=2908204 RepID=A0AA41U891_9ACTN|nr:hypothetical protein [Yinghuangia soli]MCF2532664.1 hypothetical protein [Yinghuangia soli]
MFDEITDEDSFFAAYTANDDQPYGIPRTARAEALVDAAARLDRPQLLAYSLVGAIKAYNYGGESPKSPVAMARLLRLYDEQPGEFDERLTHLLFWYLKWITSSLLAVPEVPLATIRGYQAEMERRYRTAGHSMRPVHQNAFYLARHVGDDDAAQQAFTAWLAADREELADCDACERRTQGRWLMGRGDDAGALDLFAPTLAGALSCAEEPQYTLGASLLPLVRLGRADEARGHHLRGYRKVRGKVSTYSTVAEHIEFCALTGNEGRGAEILAEHRGWLARPASDLLDHLGFLEGAAVLLNRLTATGHGRMPVADVPGTDGTAADLLALCRSEMESLTARFDTRNGTDAVTRRMHERIGQEPLAERLVLGVRSVLPAPRTAPPAPAAPAAAPPAALGLEELAARAKDLYDQAHPDMSEAWRQYAEAANAAGKELPLHDAAMVHVDSAYQARLRDDYRESAAWEDQAAEMFDAAGSPAEAAASQAMSRLSLFLGAQHDRAGHSGTDAAGPQPATVVPLPDFSDLAARTAALAADDPAHLRSHFRVLRCSAVVQLASLSSAEEEQPTAGARLAEAVDAVADAADRSGLAQHRITAYELQGQVALQRGDHDTALAAFGTAVELADKAGRPWDALHARGIRGQLLLAFRSAEEAEPDLRSAADLADTYPSVGIPSGPLRADLAKALAGQGRFEESVEQASRAADWCDAHDAPDLAANCRMGMAHALLRLGRPADAAAVAEETLPEVERLVGPDDPAPLMESYWLLGSCLQQIGEAAGAAHAFARAAGYADRSADTETRMQLTSEAAHALAQAGAHTEAELAFGRGMELLRELGLTGGLVRMLRASAWNLLEGAGREVPEATADAVLARFAEADQVVAAAPGDTGEFDRGQELMYTRTQTADALTRLGRYPEAVEAAGSEAERLAAGLPRHAEEYAEMASLAAPVEAYGLDRPHAARARLDAAAASLSAVGCPAPAERLRAVRAQLPPAPDAEG